ncbi:unnamed protein product [Brachionus calyciflorus]|uniref:ISXO2-like transposase domain-containing protein n=1 Tax=Brachionus calyciflorus TaxID=104777 RepID=A0A814GT15_9BILA|nr:unnamed protein product [Brachionus calyciflorus]
MVARVKHNVGKDLKRVLVWMFGLICRTNDECYIEIVKDRTAETLQCICYDHVEDDSIICSDSWPSYNKLTQIKNFRHETVNHKYNFVNPNNKEIHTNRIESLWRQAKEKLKDMHGCDRMHLAGYLKEFMWRHNNKINRSSAFDQIMKALATVYNPYSSNQVQEYVENEPVCHEIGTSNDFLQSEREIKSTKKIQKDKSIDNLVINEKSILSNNL